MLTHHKPVYLSLMSFDLPLWSVVETHATLYQKDHERFHLLFTEPIVQDVNAVNPALVDAASTHTAADPTTDAAETGASDATLPQTPRLLWLELSPYRIIMTMQGNGKFSYRHFWEQGVYGLSRYWLQSDDFTTSYQLRLRNFTRSLKMVGSPLPHNLRLEYELWNDKIQLGHYVLNLEIHH